jgi:hypothetical protein
MLEIEEILRIRQASQVLRRLWPCRYLEPPLSCCTSKILVWVTVEMRAVILSGPWEDWSCFFRIRGLRIHRSRKSLKPVVECKLEQAGAVFPSLNERCFRGDQPGSVQQR